MAQWGNADNANSSPLYAPAYKKQEANTSTRDAMYGNTSVGTFAADDDEVKAKKGAIAHAGWQLRTEGTGGRAGRVHYETLVAMSSVTSDGADDATLPDETITVTNAPTAQTVTAPEGALFAVDAEITPGGTLAYQWQMSTGGAYSNLADDVIYSGTTTDTLTIADSTGLGGNRFRVIVSDSAGNADSVTTTGVVLTVE